MAVVSSLNDRANVLNAPSSPSRGEVVGDGGLLSTGLRYSNTFAFAETPGNARRVHLEAGRTGKRDSPIGLPSKIWLENVSHLLNH